jgi:hypothetical protein
MNTKTSQPECEEVLSAFSVESKRDSETLQRYLKAYPQYVVEIASLSHELSRNLEKAALSEKDKTAIDAVWKKHATVISVRPDDVFASLPLLKLREVANTLDIPLQVIAAFKEHKVIVASIPKRFLAGLSAAINKTMEEVTAALAFSADPACLRSHKSDEKPKALTPVSFEKLLIDAEVPPEKRALLMADN